MCFHACSAQGRKGPTCFHACSARGPKGPMWFSSLFRSGAKRTNVFSRARATQGGYLTCGRLAPTSGGGLRKPEKSTNQHQMCNNMTRSVLGPWGGLLRPPGEASWGEGDPCVFTLLPLWGERDRRVFTLVPLWRETCPRGFTLVALWGERDPRVFTCPGHPGGISNMWSSGSQEWGVTRARKVNESTPDV